jgi:hypothetical protein
MKTNKRNFRMMALFSILFFAMPAWGINIGWFARFQDQNRLSEYSRKGANIVCMTGGAYLGVDNSGRTIMKNYLDEAHKHGIKVWVNMAREYGVPDPLTAEQYVATIQNLEGHPALAGWFIGDEPDMNSQPYWYHPDHKYDWYNYPWTMLKRSPGYYPLLKKNSTKPAWITHGIGQYWRHLESEFYEVTDFSGNNVYPFGVNTPPFPNSDLSGIYRICRDQYLAAKAANKGYIVALQGFGGDGTFRYPTVPEMRFQVYSAIVAGIDTILLFADYWQTHPESADIVMEELKRLPAKLGETIETHPIISRGPITINLKTFDVTIRGLQAPQRLRLVQ